MQNAQNADSQNSEKTPETISKAVASLPPEQMFELLKQMKQCVQVCSCVKFKLSMYNLLYIFSNCIRISCSDQLYFFRIILGKPKICCCKILSWRTLYCKHWL